ncbi:MAG: hypothetical protein H6Q86_20 [candidate division NC10 bacterium]|nr:hypothetical protein [candidate division NC10 bacterium]
MRSMRTKLLILAVLLGVWAVIFVLRRPGEPPTRTGPAQTDARVPRAAAGGGGIPKLRADLLNVARAPYPADVQNFFSAPPPPPPPPPVQSAVGPGMQGSAPALPPPDPFQEEAKQFRYVGFLRAGNSNTAFIVRGQEVHTVPVGSMLGGRFRVMEVQDDGVVLASPAGDKQVRLSLTGDSAAAPRAPGGPQPGGPQPGGPPPGPAPRGVPQPGVPR